MSEAKDLLPKRSPSANTNSVTSSKQTFPWLAYWSSITYCQILRYETAAEYVTLEQQHPTSCCFTAACSSCGLQGKLASFISKTIQLCKALLFLRSNMKEVSVLKVRATRSHTHLSFWHLTFLLLNYFLESIYISEWVGAGRAQEFKIQLFVGFSQKEHHAAQDTSRYAPCVRCIKPSETDFTCGFFIRTEVEWTTLEALHGSLRYCMAQHTTATLCL